MKTKSVPITFRQFRQELSSLLSSYEWDKKTGISAAKLAAQLDKSLTALAVAAKAKDKTMRFGRDIKKLAGQLSANWRDAVSDE